MDNKDCNDPEYHTPTGHLIGMQYESFVYQNEFDHDPSYYDDMGCTKFKFCPNCGEKLWVNN